MRPQTPTIVGLTLMTALINLAPGALAKRNAPAKSRPAVASARMIFQSLYSKSDAALEQKDLDTTLAYHDPDFVAVVKGGTEIDMGEIRYRLSTWLDLARTVRSTTSVVSANVQGVSGTVMVKSDVTMVMLNPDTRAKSTFVNRVVSKDSWAHQSDGWMLLRSQIISESTTNNGKKVADPDNPLAPAPKTDDDGDDTVPSAAPDMPTTSPDNG